MVDCEINSTSQHISLADHDDQDGLLLFLYK